MWEAYREDKTVELRNQLISYYLYIVRYQAERIHIRLPVEVEIDDLTSAGTFGLMNAIDAFDHNRGVKFETYCVTRIRGAILDELRAVDWVPRLVRNRTSRHEAIVTKVIATTGEVPTKQQIIEELKITEEKYDNIRHDCHAAGFISISRKRFETDSNKNIEEVDLLIDKTASDPASVAEKQEMYEYLIKKLEHVGALNRTFMILYYTEHLTFKEISMLFDMSESYMSIIHKAVKAELLSIISR